MERRFSYAIVLGSLLSLLGATTPLDLELLTDAADLGGPAGSTGGASWVMVLPAGQGGPGGSDPSEHDPTVVPPFEFDPNCPVHPNAARFPWERLESSVRREPAGGGACVVGAATATQLFRSGFGAAFALVREPRGQVSLYLFEGNGDVGAFNEAMLSVWGTSPLSNSQWQQLVNVPTMADFISWLESGDTVLVELVESAFAGAGTVVQYVTYPEQEQ